MDRCYSTLTLKSVDNSAGLLYGVASTPSVDSDGDIVEPGGAEFSLPIPLLWQHDSKSPIGHVLEAKTTRAGIEVTAKVFKDLAVPRIKEAWECLRSGLVQGLSIGFSVLDSTPLGKGRGLHIHRWSWRELSCVTLAANAEASISAIKSADELVRKSLGLWSEPRQPDPIFLSLPSRVLEAAGLTVQELNRNDRRFVFEEVSEKQMADLLGEDYDREVPATKQLFHAVESYLRRNLIPLHERIKALERHNHED